MTQGGRYVYSVGYWGDGPSDVSLGNLKREADRGVSHSSYGQCPKTVGTKAAVVD